MQPYFGAPARHLFFFEIPARGKHLSHDAQYPLDFTIASHVLCIPRVLG
jgi:hypothetical protein